MGKVNCGFCNKYMGFTIGLGYHPNGNGAEKSADGTWCCSSTCARDYNVNRMGNSTSQSNNSESENGEKKSSGLLGGLFGEKDASAKIAQAQMMTSLFASVDEENRQVREVIDQITKMVFSTNPTELSNQLEELAVTGVSSDKFPHSGKELKKTCYEKMEFGILKLRQTGDNASADFFEKKRKSIKPGWF